MTTEAFLASIKTTYQEAFTILKAKNQDYAASNDPFKNFKYAGYVGLSPQDAILVRLSDKFARVCNLVKTNKVAVKDETVMDTITDMINYLAILKAYLEDQKDAKVQE